MEDAPHVGHAHPLGAAAVAALHRTGMVLFFFFFCRRQRCRRRAPLKGRRLMENAGILGSRVYIT